MRARKVGAGWEATIVGVYPYYTDGWRRTRGDRSYAVLRPDDETLDLEDYERSVHRLQDFEIEPR